MTAMKPFLQQIKIRRLGLKLKQSDMLLRAGISRQQYQYIESKGNPRLDTLELVASGLDSELMLIPLEKLAEVQAILNGSTSEKTQEQEDDYSHKELSEDPWKDLLKGDYDDE